MSGDHPDSPSESGTAESPRQRAHTPTHGSILERLSRPARAATLAALGLGLGVLSLASYQQRVPLANAVAAPTTAPVVAEQVASPEPALAFAEAPAPTETPLAVAIVETVFEPEAPPVDVPSDETVVPVADGPIVDQDELLDEYRAQLAARGGRRADLLAAAAAQPTEQPSPTSTPAPTKQVTARLLVTVATKAETPRPVVKAPTKTPTKTPTKVPTKAPTKAPTKTPTPRPTTTTANSSTFGQKVANIALRYVGYRYTYGGTSPSTGFDCSGFAYFVYKTAGRPISRDLGTQYRTGVSVSRSGLQPGDLIFFQNTYRYGLSHVAIYVGSGRFAHAQSERTGVTTSGFDSYWSSHYLGARRP